MFGFYRLAAASPKIRVADVDFNTVSIIDMVLEAEKNESTAIVFPELAVTGYTCGDLFHQQMLLENATGAILRIAEKTAETKIIIIVGAPFHYGNALFNAAFIIKSGRIKGIVPKIFNPNYREFYDKRWFASGRQVKYDEVLFNGETVPFGAGLLFECDRWFKFGIELCEDLWSVIPPSSHHCIAGATATFNLSASNELVAKAEYRKNLVLQQSARCISAYVYTSAGVHESTTDLVFGGHSIIAENGAVAAENNRFQRDGSIIYADVDFERLIGTRLSESSYNDPALSEELTFKTVRLAKGTTLKSLKYAQIIAYPFVPRASEVRKHRCEEIFNIQTAALARRLDHTGMQRVVIGVSGGLDSTLALLVCAETCKLLELARHNIIAVTMPGFGTTDRTYNNALEMIRLLGTDCREINIREACLKHFKDIGHDSEVHDTTYENVQARERTQILMDVANREKGLVVGTGDLSEIALGWSTYSGDHISMYAVNCGVPKTLIRYLIAWVAESTENKLRDILQDIIATPVSPELLPSCKNGEIKQKTEEIIGPYDLHDFFLYHLVKYGASPEKILFLAKLAFKDIYMEPQIKKYLGIFLNRFFSQQFKRSCIPDGPKVGSISLSPRGDWRMPSDVAAALWLKGF